MVFAGDGVRLAGQMDYPLSAPPASGYPLLFLIHFACCGVREDYDEYARIGLESGYAVFRWDKRGMGRSGGGGRGSTTQDAVNAYEFALSQPMINRRRAVVLALGSGSGLYGSSFGLFARIQHPHASLLVANLLDEQDILAIDTPVFLIAGGDDWNSPMQYAAVPAKAHRKAYKHGAEAFIAPTADRRLKTEDGEMHPRAVKEIQTWLKSIQQVSPSF
jgi:hypothetical protein